MRRQITNYKTEDDYNTDNPKDSIAREQERTREHNNGHLLSQNE